LLLAKLRGPRRASGEGEDNENRVLADSIVEIRRCSHLQICRLKPEENQQLVERLLEEFPRMQRAEKILPPLSRPLRRCFCGTPHSIAGR